MTEVQEAFLDALGGFRALVQADAVGAAWSKPSALDGYTVGALVGHGLNTASAVERYLDQEPSRNPPIAKGAYYAPVPSTTDDPELHAGIRTRAEATAEQGQQAVIEQLDALSTRLRERLATESPTRVVEVMGYASMLLDDYLESRVLELVVHSDDVAVSVDVSVDIPANAAAIAVRHLVAVAEERHGDLALVRAFTRRERDNVEALRVF